MASRIGQGEFRNVYGSNGSNVTAGQQDYAERMNQIENQREAYYKLAGVAPGLPTMKGSYADPEVTGKGYNILIDSLGDHSVPENWVQRPVVNTEAGSNPGAPLAWGSPENPDDAVAGYGYVAADTSEVEETFYYHSDHLGSTAYITDQKANVTQYDAYLPYGELLVDEHSSSADLPYKFNGKELDEETGLYYYGARYMNPVTSMWYGVDPLAEKYPNVSAFVYCMGNPIKLVDLDGLFPRKILIKGSSDTEYKLTTVAVKLLSLVSGVNENYIQNITVKEWNLLPENWSMTLGNTPDNVTIKSSSSYFTDDDNSDNIKMIYNYAHEVGHIKQIARDGDSYVSNCTKHYILTMSHDNSPYEIEADMGYATLCAFANYARRFSKTGKDVISGIINSNKSDEIKLRLINKYWKSYMKYLKNQDNNLGKYSTKTLQNATQKAQEEKRDATMVEKRK